MGLKNFLLAFFSGLLLVGSWMTKGVPLLLFVGFVPLLWVSYKLKNLKTKKVFFQLFFSAYFCFFIFNILTTYWLIYASVFGMWFAVLANSFLMALVFLLYHLLSQKATEIQGSIILISLWVCFEKFHMNWDFSWPWLNLGNGFATYHKWVQWYEYTGVLGGTVWILVCNLIFLKALKNWKIQKDKKAFFKNIILGICVIIFGIYSSLYLYHNLKIQKQNKIQTLILQPNVDPYLEKYQISNTTLTKDLVQLAEKKMDAHIQFLIAPETTLPNLQNIKTFSEKTSYFILKAYLNRYPKSSFLGGITFFEAFSDTIPKNATANIFSDKKGWYNSFNSAFFMNNQIPEFSYYHKSKLVVGVEHIPYRQVFKFLMNNKTLDLGGSLATLTTQKERAVFSHQNTKMAPIICYESVYGNYVREYVKKGAEFLTIITNDGWWGNSQGHKQHLFLAKLRAIETRKPILRSANTGVSAVIDAKGDILKSLPYGKKDVLKATIFPNKNMTFYVKYGDMIFGIAVLFLFLTLPTLFLKKRF